MPIYEYECRACRHRFERLVRPATPPDAAMSWCPSCQSEDLERLLSLFAVSSDGTHQANLQQARKAGLKGGEDRKQEEIELIKHIATEHQH